MRRILKTLLVLLVIVMAVVLVVAPFVVPPIVERLAEEKLAAFGVGADVSLKFGYCWRNGPGVEGTLRVSLPKTPWDVRAAFGASCSEWSAKVTMRETSFNEQDALLRALLDRYPLQGVTNLLFSGSVALEASAERTFSKPVPVWRAKVPVKGLNVSLVTGKLPVDVAGFSVTASASGIADHVDIGSMYPRAQSLTIGAFHATNFYASVRATDRALIVNEAGSEFCGGKANVYSLYLNPENLNAGFSLFLDNVDAGAALAQFSGFRGEASGRLHGKLRAFIQKGGKAIGIRDAFLYSTPGEVGKLRIRDSAEMVEKLAYAGMDDAYRANVAEALTDLDYRVLRMDLVRTGENTARLSWRISGSATRGETTVPVDLTINLNGEIERLINMGLDYSAKMKGNK